MLALRQGRVEAGAVPGVSDGEPFGDRLKCYFDDLTSGPAPDRIAELAEALERALECGALPGFDFGFRA